MSSISQTLGIVGEELAGQFLSAQGYKILLKNYECALGEIDLIAKENGCLVFVEVKTRRSLAMGLPAESVTFQKRHQIVKTAEYYVKRYGIKNVPCRFDVVSVLIESGGNPQIEIIKGAFEAEE
ncbi:MAG: YraN family protein [Omnitrophica bacterium RIFCSPHIGHO2_02_FULL_51_18]|nr:MAG: YraN family protein [Omnitrophica bacterium RIFCSPHIGHO2_02_FULL_51_18]